MVRRLQDAVGGGRVEHVRDRPGHDRRYALDDDATRRELAWAPHVPFTTGLPDTVRWYRSNAAWASAVAGPELRASWPATTRNAAAPADPAGRPCYPPPMSTTLRLVVALCLLLGVVLRPLLPSR